MDLGALSSAQVSILLVIYYDYKDMILLYLTLCWLLKYPHMKTYGFGLIQRQITLGTLHVRPIVSPQPSGPEQIRP